MALIKRYYYGASIDEFLNQSDAEVKDALNTNAREFITTYSTQGRSWDRELEDLRSFLTPYRHRGSIVLEYSIPRLGRRIDVVLLIDGVVFILEYKAFKDEFLSADRIQVWDYALDLKNFHKESARRYIVPILIATDAEAHTVELSEPYEHVYAPVFCNTTTLPATIESFLLRVPHIATSTDMDWLNSQYEPTPTIIEAVTHMYRTHNVKEITNRGSDDQDFYKTCDKIKSIIEHAKTHGEKAICFVTGVPGAGKTLVGLDIAAKYLEEEGRAVYLSGNGPLVEVLCEALARDLVRRSVMDYERKVGAIEYTTKKELAEKKRLIDKPITKKSASSQVQAVIQMVHRYRKACLENAEFVDGRIVEKRTLNTDRSNFVPIDHVAIFDESQRAWTQRGLAKFMNEKYSWADFPFSEPEFLISCIDRHQDWGVVVCLVGGGQEINHDEAGIGEWIEALNRYYPDWHIYISDQLHDSEYMAGEALAHLAHHQHVHYQSELHLAVTRRSFKAERLAHFVKALLDMDVDKARQELAQMEDYKLFITRDLDKAKATLREWSEGSERYGLLVSSKAERLKPLAINVRVKPSVTAYFLNGPDDIRSSLFLEDAVSEFDVQGLELDYSCLVWDADFQYTDKGWKHYSLGTKTDDGESIMCWRNINDKQLQDYQTNAYRVLLTRARQGMVICVPTGDTHLPPEDSTRLPEFYDATYNYLKSLGIKEI